MSVDATYFNNKDLSLVAYADDGSLMGFIWAGLMCKNTVAYIDKFAVDPAYAGKGVGHALQMELFRQGAKRGVRRGLGVIKHDEYFNRSAKDALKMAAMADPVLYSLVQIDVMNTLKELIAMENHNGR